MTTWIFKKEFKTHNPMCYDLGNIEKVILGDTGKYSDYRKVEKIIADGKPFNAGCSKRFLSLINGWFDLKQVDEYPPLNIEDEDKEEAVWDRFFEETTLILKEPPKDGHEYDMTGKRSMRMDYKSPYYDPYGPYSDCSPVCCDPRLLYIMDRNWEMNNGERPEGGLTDADWERFCNDIPTKEQALAWLKQRGYQAEPVPFQSPESMEVYHRIKPYGGPYPGIKALDFLN